jgi:hypothetical protein
MSSMPSALPLTPYQVSRIECYERVSRMLLKDADEIEANYPVRASEIRKQAQIQQNIIAAIRMESNTTTL